MNKLFIIFISLATIVVGEQDFSVPTDLQGDGSRTEMNNENVDHNYENSIESLDPEAEKALISWVSNMDCSEALMGEMKCMIVKNLHKESYNNPEITSSMQISAIEYLIGHLMAENQVDPELDIIIHKYFKEYLDIES